MKKVLFCIMVVLSVTTLQVASGIIEVVDEQGVTDAHIELQSGELGTITVSGDYNLEINPQRGIASSDMLGHISKSLFRTFRAHPLFSALAVWALLFSRETIKDHWIISAMITADLLSEFSLHMLQ